MSTLLNIGRTGLNAAQAQLATTSHNITNASTPGYHRQTVRQTMEDPLLKGTVFFGQGTKVAAIERSYSQFLENQVMLSDNRRAEFATYNLQISQIDNVLADPTSGLSPAMDQFFAALQDVSANPTNTASRQALLSSGQSLVARFNALDDRLSEVRNGVEADLRASVEQINSYAREIADLNQRIVVAQSAGAGVPANDLLDQRQQALFELNQLIKVTSVNQDDGSVAVFIGSGQALVLGTDPAQFDTTVGQDEAGRQSITLLGKNGTEVVVSETLLNGGSLGGLLAFRREALDTTQRSLGLIATTLATAFNTQHKLGTDLDGMLGQDFFNLGPVGIQPPDAATITIDPDKLGELTGSDYTLSNTGGTYTLTNLTTGASQVVTATAPGNTFEGLKIGSLSLADGETARIQPTRYAAGELSMAISQTSRVAAGNPVAITVPSANTGSMSVSNVLVKNVTGMDASPALPASPDGVPDFSAISVSWAANTLTVPAGYTLTSGTPPTADNSYDPVTDGPGKTFTLTAPGGFSFEFTVSGVPASGDGFSFGPNTGGVADNRNAVLLGALQTAKLMFNNQDGEPTTTMGNAYAQIVTSVGNKTREVKASEAAQEALMTQAKNARDALSAVNLDEEAANLVRFQQAYQASARVMTVAQTLFDELLSIAR